MLTTEGLILAGLLIALIAITALEWRDERRRRRETPRIVAGALYDFAGYLTTNPLVMVVGATEDASLLGEELARWAARRGLSLHDAAVEEWRLMLQKQS